MAAHLRVMSFNPSFSCPPPYVSVRASAFATVTIDDGPIRDWILTGGRATNITKITPVDPVDAGSGNSYSRYETDAGPYFVKINRTSDSSAFEVEALANLAIFKSKSVRVPKPFKVGTLPGGGSFFIMENVEFGAPRNNQAVFGMKLAEMHEDGINNDGYFGFELNNTIGSTLQINSWSTDWIEFYGQYRLGYQLQLAKDEYGDSAIYDKGHRLIKSMKRLFDGTHVKPYLLHGDLWSRNLHCNQFGDPLLLDPASYYGHHEAEFGLSWRAFFGTTFFRTYFRYIAKEPGFERRRNLYKLYHYLNHYNMFGPLYREPAMAIIEDYLNMLRV